MTYNKTRRVSPPFWVLLFMAGFSVWQMGIFFYCSNALSINRGTPLPVDVDVTAGLIIAGYLLSIAALIPFQRLCVTIARVCLAFAFCCSAGLFFPLPAKILAFLFYGESFICVFFIGVIMATSITALATRSTLIYCLLMAILSGIFVPLLQGGLISAGFTVFNALSLVLTALMLAAFFWLPARTDVEYCDPAKVSPPRALQAAVYVFIALSCLVTLFGSSYAETVDGGFAVYYLSSAAAAVLFLFLWRKKNASPFKLASAYILTAATGFLLAIAALAFPRLRLLACALNGIGMTACIMSEFFAACLFERSASRFVVPIAISVAMCAVGVQSAALELLRDDAAALAAVYGVIVVLGAAVYMKIEPHVSYNWTRDEAVGKSIGEPEDAASGLPWFFSLLSPQERAVTDLIMRGYATKEISEITGISVNTQKFYRKNIYLKLGIHSRSELFELALKKPG